MVGRKPGSQRDRKRVKTQADAAGLLGLSPQRLQDMRRNAPWWNDALCNDDGWDVVGIALTQQEYHTAGSGDDDASARELSRRTAAAKIAELEETAQIKALERQKRERVEAQEAGQLVRVDVVQSLLVEALAELRRAVDDVPYVFSQQVPAELRHLVWVEESGVRELSRLAPLQRIILKVVEDYQRWLDRVPEEVFDLTELAEAEEAASD